MQKIKLIIPRMSEETANNFPKEIHEHLGVGYISSYLRSNGVLTEVIDLNLEAENTYSHKFATESVALVGISCMCREDLQNVINIAKIEKKKGGCAHVNVGGHYASNNWKEILEEFDVIDSVTIGEGEVTTRALYSSVVSKKDLNSVKGIAYRDNREVVVNKKRKPIQCLDSLPFPDRYNLDRKLKYNENGRGVYVLSSRGCSGKCSFCVASFNNGWRSRSADDVINELRMLYNKGARFINFCDENFIGNKHRGRKRALAIASKIVKEGLKIKFYASFRADLIDDELLEALIHAGMVQVNIGVESFLDRQLTLYNKRIRGSEMMNKCKMIVGSGVEARFTFIQYDPYLEPHEARENLLKLKELKGHVDYWCLYSKLQPRKGANIFKLIQEDGLLTEQNGNYDFRFNNKEIQSTWLAICEMARLTADTEAKIKKLRLKVITSSDFGEQLVFDRQLLQSSMIKMFDLWYDFIMLSLTDPSKEAIKNGLAAGVYKSNLISRFLVNS